MTEDRPEDTTSDDALEALLAEHRDPAPEEVHPESAGAVDPFAHLAPPQPAAEQASAESDNTSSLPDAPLFALLRNVEQEVGVDRIDRIWVFPPRRLEAGETAVVVVAAFPDLADDRRRVYAAHYTARQESREPSLALDEYGTAPTERVGRLVEEVVERIKDEPAGAPRSHEIEGRDDRWNAVLHELAGRYLEEVQKDPRLRR